MFKHANRGALPAMLVLGVLIGASLAVASPSHPKVVAPSASPPVIVAPSGPAVGGGTTGSEGAADPHGCAHAIAALAHGDHGLSQAIARVLAKCKENPQAPGLVNALLHRPGNAGKGGGGSSEAGEGGGPRGGASAGSEGSGGSGAGGSASGESGGSGSDGSGSGGSGSGGSGSTGGQKDANGKAKGHFDGKGKNG